MTNASVTMPPVSAGAADTRAMLNAKMHPAMLISFIGLVACGLLYTVYALYADVANSGAPARSVLPFILLGIALLVALGFEFVNGFHDTANAVATVIYTHSLPPHFAVVWSGMFNFLGVLTSSGAVAFGILSLLPVELILQVGSDAGFAMVFALLIAAIVWNIGTWSLGLPASSSHTLIGSIIGVGLANQLMAPAGSNTSGVDWGQALNVGETLLVSPIVGFVGAALLLLAMKALIKSKQLYDAPKSDAPPPAWIRGLLVLTCTGVSFAHGSNDGQKGMGLIMLILIGTVPTAYALNRAMPEDQVAQFHAVAQATEASLTPYASGVAAPADFNEGVGAYVRSKELKPETIPSLIKLIDATAQSIAQYGSLSKVPTEIVTNVRNGMYLSSEAIRLMQKAKSPAFDADTNTNLTAYKKDLDGATKFIPLWVKVAVAIALGLGTMVGWKRIVVTVGSKIGKTHMTYGQGAAAELVAMGTIFAADWYGLPVSTTHVLSSGVAGTMAANKSGLQWGTVRNLAMAWVLTLPAAILLSGTLYFIFRHIF
jgi:PiT family inorganic phosphate transporter